MVAEVEGSTAPIAERHFRMIDFNPLPKQALFTTPADFKQIEAMIEGMPRAQRGIGYTIAAMTWNYASQVIDTEISKMKESD